ncbi:hypothetical protein KS4_15990 [Poriferisphaera corsica]|uniref:Uncharacterized protein n=1 Tax=Poriferisphaera corsica TaxID=2528020 RepID=A0A517YTK8_9BACT|nr:hypothetical protein [Poriferisphaera corsica]QDU33548.1 hypothetical protein KS4_15990 [Poriferisphaera corsica]
MAGELGIATRIAKWAVCHALRSLSRHDDAAKHYFEKAYTELKNHSDVDSGRLARIGKIAGCL